MTDKFTTVLFDLGRVLVNIDFDAFPLSLGIDPKLVQKEEKAAVGRLVVRYETGRLTSDEFFQELGDFFDNRFSQEHLMEAWNSIIRDENSAIVPIVEAIQVRYDTAVLSNTSPTHIKKAMETTTILRRFPRQFLSFQLGAVKPARELYDRVIRELSVEPAGIVLIDHIAENVDAASRCGMVGILYTGVPTLEEDLHNLGLLT